MEDKCEVEDCYKSPIKTINDTIEWTEEIKQPWELNGEFKWLDNMKQLQIENPTIEIQERNSTDRIIELQNHIAKLENEINIKDQLNEGLRGIF